MRPLARALRDGLEAAGLSVLALTVFLFMFIDMVIDPVALRGDRWFLGKIYYYPDPGVHFGVPFANYVGWAVVGTLALAVYVPLERRLPSSPRSDSPTPRLLLGVGLYYGVLFFNLGVTFWIGEWLMGASGLLMHLPILQPHFAAIGQLGEGDVFGVLSLMTGERIAADVIARAASIFDRVVVGVVRDRLGALEDQFLSTVFMGSGLLFLAMMFVAAAIAGGIVTSYNIAADVLVENGVITFGRAVMYSITNVYAIRMAGVFMISSGTLWLRTGVMPRGLAFLTYGLAIVLLVTPTFSLWLILVFPTWVLIISIFILVRKPLGESTAVKPGSD